MPHLAAPAHLARHKDGKTMQSKRCATTLWGASLAVVWGFGPQHGRCQGYGKNGKMPLKKKTLGLATNGQKMSKTEKGQKCCATKVCLHMAKQRWTNQHVCLQHTRYIRQNVRFWGTLAQNMSPGATHWHPPRGRMAQRGGHKSCKSCKRKVAPPSSFAALQNAVK